MQRQIFINTCDAHTKVGNRRATWTCTFQEGFLEIRSGLTRATSDKAKLLTEGQVVFLRVLQYSSTFSELSTLFSEIFLKGLLNPNQKKVPSISRLSVHQYGIICYLSRYFSWMKPTQKQILYSHS